MIRRTSDAVSTVGRVGEIEIPPASISYDSISISTTVQDGFETIKSEN